MDEEILKGGQSTESVVRIGDTVHRSVNENSEFIHSLLNLLEEKGYEYSPRFLGMDPEGREILTFIDGDRPENIEWSDEQLKTIVGMIRKLHDISAGSELVRNAEVICHGDLAPWNTIIKDNEIVGFIDFDDAHPGRRIDEVAYFLWTFLDLGDDLDVEIQSNKVKMLVDEYGLENKEDLVDAIIGQQRKILKFREDQINENINDEFNKVRVEEIKKQIEWIEVYRDKLI